MFNNHSVLKSLFLYVLLLGTRAGNIQAQIESIHSRASGATLIDLLQADHYPTRMLYNVIQGLQPLKGYQYFWNITYE